jgi:hypothetical protein
MGEWEFLYDMKDEGYSEDAIQEAMTSGASPSDWEAIDKQERKAMWIELKSLRDTGAISKEEFKKRKTEIFS